MSVYIWYVVLVIFCVSFQIYFLPCPGRVNYHGIIGPMTSICVQPMEGIDKRSKDNRKEKLKSIFPYSPFSQPITASH